MFHIVEGLEGNRAAVVWKFHHTVADGIGAGRLSESFLQSTREAAQLPEVDLKAAVADAVAADNQAHGTPSVVSSVVETLRHTAHRQAGIARRALDEVAKFGVDPFRARNAVAGVVRTGAQVRSQLFEAGAGGGATESNTLPPGSPLWRQRSRHRQLELLSFSFAEASAAAKLLGGSLNDWFVTGAINGVIGYHDARGIELHSLNTSFVVSTRTDRAIGGNSFTPTRLSVPAGPMTPAERFDLISATMKAKRAEVSGQGLMAGLAGIANLLPTLLVTSVARSQAARMDFATSNLRGARSRLYISGARVDANYPFGPVAGTAFNLTVMSYAGTLDMGLFVDPVAVEAPADLRDHLESAYRQLLPASTPVVAKSRKPKRGS